MNAEQTAFLHRHGVDSVHDLPDPIRRLEFTEIDATPDPVAAPSLSDAQVQYLGGRTVKELDSVQRSIFAGLATTTESPVATASDTHATPPRTSGEPKLDVRKLSESGLTPTARGEIYDHWQVLQKAHREAMSGIPEHLRTTRYDVARASEYCAPYLIT